MRERREKQGEREREGMVTARWPWAPSALAMPASGGIVDQEAAPARGREGNERGGPFCVVMKKEM